MLLRSRAVLVLLLLLAAAQPAPAVGAGSSQAAGARAAAALGARPAPASAGQNRLGADARPVEMTSSGGLSIDLNRHLGHAHGDVLIKRDDVLVCCDDAVAHYTGNQIERLTCRGRVVIVRPDGTRATAQVAVFQASEDRVTLTGDARVYSEEANLSGDRIIYDVARDHLEVEGGRSKFKYKPETEADRAILARPCPPGSAEAPAPPPRSPPARGGVKARPKP